MLLNEFAFPVNLTTWHLQIGGQDICAYYREWPADQPNPSAGGFGMVAWDLDPDDGNAGTNQFAVYWLAPGQLALQATDKQVYAAVSAGAHKPDLGLADGSQYNNQLANTAVTGNATFNLVNLGHDASIALQCTALSPGQYLGATDTGWQPDWHFTGIVPNGQIGQAETLAIVSGSRFAILLVSGSGVGLNLVGQDFSQGGYLQSIAGVDFAGAVLTNANLASLPVLDLTGCNFTGAYVNGTNLNGARNLNQAAWNGAVLYGTDLTQVDPAGTPGTTFKGVDFTLANLSNLDLAGADFTGANLTGANLSGANLTSANFTSASFIGANLTGATLLAANLTNANFTGATLAGADLTQATLSQTVFDSVDLGTTTFGPSPAFGTSAATRTSFQQATVPAPSLGLCWSYIDLTGATVTDIPQDLTGLVAVNTLFPDAISLAGIVLENANLGAAQLFYADLTGANLGSATLDNAFLKGATLTGANLSSATLLGTWLIAEDWGGDPNKPEAAKASGAFLVNTVLDQCQATGVDFSGAVFVSPDQQLASAQGAFMDLCNFSDAWVVNVAFRGTQLAGAQFVNAVLVASTFPSCTITPTSDSYTVPSMHDANICGTLFADVAGVIITNPANMDGLEMDGATYSTASGLYKQRIPVYGGGHIDLVVPYGATVLGTTTSQTTCPNGCEGPCTL